MSSLAIQSCGQCQREPATHRSGFNSRVCIKDGDIVEEDEILAPTLLGAAGEAWRLLSGRRVARVIKLGLSG